MVSRQVPTHPYLEIVYMLTAFVYHPRRPVTLARIPRGLGPTVNENTALIMLLYRPHGCRTAPIPRS